MYKTSEASLWQGRIDSEESLPTWRWHQRIKNIDVTSSTEELNGAKTLVGFACDEGVRRNKGRVGAAEGPDAIRKRLSNFCLHNEHPLFDAGTVYCEDKELESAQSELAETICKVLEKNGTPVILGGGHEIAWGSFQGISRYLGNDLNTRSLGIINFDAHFDLRNATQQPSSGTPFRQIAETQQSNNNAFHYQVIGLNQQANTSALFSYAEDNRVQWIEDIDCHWNKISEAEDAVERFIATKDYLYLSVCMDVFSASHAPGVSAPAALGIDPLWFFALLEKIKTSAEIHNTKIILMDIAETSPPLDRENQTAGLAARIAAAF